MASLPSGRKKRKVRSKSLAFKTTFVNTKSTWNERVSLSLHGDLSGTPAAGLSSSGSDRDLAVEHGEVVDQESGGGLSSYMKRKISTNLNWAGVRDGIVHGALEESCLPRGVMCVVCREEEASIRCRDCGFRQYFCRQCAASLHGVRNLFHVLEIWKVSRFPCFTFE